MHEKVHSDDEKLRMISRDMPRPDASAPAKPSWSLGDWLCMLVIWTVGHNFDHMAPFERELKPQLNDPNIAYHHTPVAQQVYPPSLLWNVSLYLPLGLITAIGLLAPPNALAAVRVRLLAELWLGQLSSIGLAFALICIVKVNVGRLRPDFLARCLPVDGVCTGAADVITEGRKSFPSGHSALAFSGLAFVSLVLAARLVQASPRAGALWKLCVASLPWLLALHLALSRVADYWHHWEDVLVGSLIGHVAAYVAFRLRFPVPAVGLMPHTLRAEVEQEMPLKYHASPPLEPV